MLRINCTRATQACVTYIDERISCNTDDSQWLLLQRTNGPLTCLVTDVPSAVSTYAHETDGVYTVAPKDERIAPRVIKVMGNVLARIMWEKEGDVKLIVEAGARVYFMARNPRARLITLVRNNSKLLVAGTLHSVVPTVDGTSFIDTRAARTKTSMRLGFEGSAAVPIEFPHAEHDCRRVEDDTPLDQQCGTCYERIKNAVFSPCGHEYMCLVCARRCQRAATSDFRCPLCRTSITAVTPH